MYAIVKTGGKQYKVTEGLVFETELLNLDVDSTLELEVVLAVNEEQVFAGEEAKQVKVLATVVEHGKGKKSTSLLTKPKRTFVNVKVTDNLTQS